MTRKDYQTIARALIDTNNNFLENSKTLSPDCLRSVKSFYDLLTDKLCLHIKLDNKEFNKDRFLESLE
mgnify:CR=1 FL=1